jgi:hypothetical protein
MEIWLFLLWVLPLTIGFWRVAEPASTPPVYWGQVSMGEQVTDFRCSRNGWTPSQESHIPSIMLIWLKELCQMGGRRGGVVRGDDRLVFHFHFWLKRILWYLGPQCPKLWVKLVDAMWIGFDMFVICSCVYLPFKFDTHLYGGFAFFILVWGRIRVKGICKRMIFAMVHKQFMYGQAVHRWYRLVFYFHFWLKRILWYLGPQCPKLWVKLVDAMWIGFDMFVICSCVYLPFEFQTHLYGGFCIFYISLR